MIKKNPNEIGARKLLNELHKRRDKIVLMWEPGHAGIHGNELADQAAKSALEETTDQRETYAAIDLLKWIREKLKTHEKRIIPKGMNRREQVVISRIRMGYSNLTHSHIVNKESDPECQPCQTKATFEHILWELECPTVMVTSKSVSITVTVTAIFKQ
jgi:hypothetical protein